MMRFHSSHPQIMGGMRSVPGLLYETSLLDAEEGIRFRGFTIPDLQAGPSSCQQPSCQAL